MSNDPEVLAIIPARGGSEGIPRKNIVDIGGKPLLAYAIECALKSTWNPRVVVSTDDEEIASVARTYGAEVPALRPEEHSGSRAHLEGAVHHMVDTLAESGYRAAVHCILLPTHIFRKTRVLDKAVEYIRHGYHHVQMLRPVVSHGPIWFKQREDGRLRALSPQTPTPTAPWWSHTWYRPYGYLSVYSSTAQPLGTYFLPVVCPIESIDIDTPEDLELARQVVREKLYDFDGK